MTSRSLRRSRRSRASQGVAAALFGWSSWLAVEAAHAESAAALTLRWQAPAGCPQQAEVKDRIRALTGTMRTAATSLQAEGTITQIDGTHFHLKLVTRSGTLLGERSLDASSCEDLTGAAAVSVALLLRAAELPSGDTLASQRPGEATTGSAASRGNAQPPGTAPTPSDAQTPNDAHTTSGSQTASGEREAQKPKATSAAGAATSTQKKPKTEAERDSDESEAQPSEIIQRPIRTAPRAWRVLAELPMGVLSFGPLPKPSWGLAFAGGASLDDWRVLLGGAAWLRQSITAEQSPDYGADIDRLTGTFKACRAINRARFEVAPCLALSLEHIAVRGTGAGVTARTEQATWLAVGAGVQGRLPLTSWLSVLVGADAQIETARPVISIDGAGEVKQLGFAAFTATVGPEWIL